MESTSTEIHVCVTYCGEPALAGMLDSMISWSPFQIPAILWFCNCREIMFFLELAQHTELKHGDSDLALQHFSIVLNSKHRFGGKKPPTTKTSLLQGPVKGKDENMIWWPAEGKKLQNWGKSSAQSSAKGSSFIPDSKLWNISGPLCQVFESRNFKVLGRMGGSLRCYAVLRKPTPGSSTKTRITLLPADNMQTWMKTALSLQFPNECNHCILWV